MCTDIGQDKIIGTPPQDGLSKDSYRLQSLFSTVMFLNTIPANIRHRLSHHLRTFDNDRLSLTVFQNPVDHGVYLLFRILKDCEPWFSLRGSHELCIMREGSSLQFRRWSNTDNRPKLWATLFFRTWEGWCLMRTTQHYSDLY